MLQEISDPELFDSHASHLTQSWAWGEFRRQTPNVKKVLRLGHKDRHFQIFIHHFHHLPLTIAYLPRSPMPTADEIASIRSHLHSSLFLKIEPTSGQSPLPPSSAILPQHTIYIDLTKTETQLLAGMHEKTRYNIHLAEKKSVVVKQENSPAALETFIRLLSQTESRQGFYSHYPDYYRLLWKMMKPILLIAYVNEAPAAAIMLLKFKDFLYYPYGGSQTEFREFMAPHLLHWEAIKLGKKLGCKTYDLWGSYKDKKVESDPFWGIYRFKSGLGGSEIDFPSTFDIPLSPLYSFYPALNSLRWTFLKWQRT